MATRALVDANVLYSRTLRDWLLMIQVESSGGLYELAWTEDILAEAITRIRANNPNFDGGRITHIRDKITEILFNGRIADFVIDDSFSGEDPKDRHVHAAAITGQVDYLITADGGFTSPSINLDKLPYEVHTPDEFFRLVDDSAPHHVRAVAQKQNEHWKARPHPKTLPDALRDAGCNEFAERVRMHLADIALEANRHGTRY